MMKPTQTSLIARSIQKELGLDVYVSANALTEDLSFPSVFTDSLTFSKQYFSYNLLRKREPRTGSYDPTIAMRNSITKFVDSEWTCRVINMHGRYFSPTCLKDKLTIESVLSRTKSMLAHHLSGVFPDFENRSFSAGSTSSSRRVYSHPCIKASGFPDPLSRLDHNLACNQRSSELLQLVFDANPRLESSLNRRLDSLKAIEPTNTRGDLITWLAQGSKPVLDSVPKDQDSVRIIVKSGGMQVLLQQAMGSALSKVLLDDFGVDLRDQTVNQEWAEIGSITNLIATVDLSSASDNIAIRWLDLFPPRWQEYIMAVRDDNITVGRTTHKLEKLAGMGNGFIFELETMLFLCIALSVCTECNAETSFVTCYGDDIIIPSKAYEMLTLVFSYMGFSVNSSKSYHNGPFRESCGKHYHNGNDVTPFYIRGDVDDLGDLYHVYNGIRSWSYRTGIDLSKSLKLLLNLIPKKHRIRVPENFGSRSGIFSDVADIPVRYCKHLQRFRLAVKRLKPSTVCTKYRLPDEALILLHLSALEQKDLVLAPSMVNPKYRWIAGTLYEGTPASWSLLGIEEKVSSLLV